MAGIPQVITEDRASGAQFIDGSLTINGSNQYLTRTHPASNTRTWTFSCWVKKQRNAAYHQLFTGFSTGANQSGIIFFNDDTLQIYSQGGLTMTLKTSAVYRDSGWMNVVVAVDTTQSTAADRVKLWVNGTRVTSFGTETYPSQNDQTYVNQNITHYVCSNQPSSNTFYGQYAQAYFIDGQALGPEEFGYTDPLTNTWRPKKYDGAFTKSSPNNGTNWTQSLSATSGTLSNGANAFDGNLSTRAQTANAAPGKELTFAPPAINFTTSLEVYCDQGTTAPTATWNGNTVNPGGGAWVTVYSGSGELSSTYPLVINTEGAAQYATLKGVRIDGEILIDNLSDTGANSFYLPLDGNSPVGKDQSGNGNDWRPVNFGGSVELPKATGAIPILNTNEAGTVAKLGAHTDSKTYTVTASGGKYYLDGVLTPTLNFLRGGTYIFDYTAASGHPFKFSTTADGTHNSGSEYTDGTNTATTNVMKITVPHNAPDTLYYYCSQHPNMGSSINVTTDIFRADPYAWKNVLALPLVGSKNDESDKINATSTAKATAVANNAVASNASSNFYGGSYYFDGTGDDIDATITALGTRDFTLECWNETTATSGLHTLFEYGDHTSNGFIIETTGSSGPITLFARDSTSGSAVDIANATYNSRYSFGRGWHHIALQRSSNVATLFVDGIRVGTATWNSNYSSTNLRIGNATYSAGSAEGMLGYIQDVRLYDGVAKYSASADGEQAFIVPSTSPDILPDTPSGVSGGSKLTKITEGAVSFDGTGDYLSTSVSSSDFTFGTGDFTIEMFLYNRETGGKGFIQFSDSSGGLKNTSSGVITIHKDASSQKFRAYAKNQSTEFSTVVPYKRWCHVALVRESGTIKLFVDGKQDATTISSDTTNYATTYVAIGGYYDTSYLSDCIISNVRVIKGTALYTSEFTPPTEPLTEVTNTKLLCCQSNTSASAATVAPGTFVNDGTNYSSGNQVTGSAGLRDVDSIFDGHLRSTGNPLLNEGATVNISSDNYILWTPTTGIPYSSKVEVFCYAANGYEITNYYTFNGGTETTFTGGSSNFNGNAWITVATGSGTINSIKIRITRGSGNQTSVNWYAVRVDGTILINDYNGKSIGKYDNTSATNFNPFTDDINTIRGQETGYATLNPLLKGSNTTLSNGNLTVSSSGGTFDGFATGTILIPKTGKWFVEFTAGSLPSSTYYGMYNTRTWNPNGFGGTGFFGLQADSGNKFKSTGSGAYMPAVSVGDAVGVMYDADNNTLGFMRNGINYGVAFNSSDGIDYTDHHSVWWNTNGSTSISHTINFGQKPFKFPPPDGFQPLSLSTVRPEKVIARPDQYVSATLFTGSGDAVSSRTVELPHAADLVWAKSRDRASAHQWVDTVRGNNSVLQSNTNMTARNPTTQYSGGGISTIDGKTITIASGTSNNANLNTNNNKGVIWSWKAGGSKGTFNVDDVGYANASDVNMNVGALNSSTFLKGQVWSGLMSAASGSFDQAASRAFDGFLRTDPNRLRTSGNQVTVTMNLSSTPVTVSSQIKVHAEPGYNSSCTVTVGGVTHTSSTGALHTFNVSGSLTQMTLQSTQSGGRTYMEGMEIDGKLLVDDNITVNAPSVENTGCSVGTKQGFSIISYNATGSNLRVSHGLSERPGFIILKTVHSTTGDWLVWHQSLDGVDRFLKLNDNSVPQAQADNVFLSIDENTFGTGDDSGINSDGQQKIAYLWHDVPGLQKFGMWYGNGSTNGPFIETGFRPAIIYYKDITGTGFWNINDSSRTTYNELTRQLYPATSDVENHHNSNRPIDFLSNGFKIRSANGAINDVNKRYVYCAWAEAPSINLYGAQSNAF